MPCPAGLQLARECYTDDKILSVTNTSQIAFTANPRRIALGWTCPTSGRITMNFGDVAADTQGFIIPANLANNGLRLEDFGRDLLLSINVIANVAGPLTMYIWQVVHLE